MADVGCALASTCKNDVVIGVLAGGGVSGGDPFV